MTDPTARPGRGTRIFIGLVTMTAIVVVVWGFVALVAGPLGVPYFKFTSANGSKCVNTLLGYECRALTVKDFELYSQFELPPKTTVTQGTYVATHNFTLDAVLRTDKAHAAAMIAALNATYGGCVSGALPDVLAGTTSPCRRSTDSLSRQTDKPPPPVMYAVSSGYNKDGSLTTVVHLQSR